MGFVKWISVREGNEMGQQYTVSITNLLLRYAWRPMWGNCIFNIHGKLMVYNYIEKRAFTECK